MEIISLFIFISTISVFIFIAGIWYVSRQIEKRNNNPKNAYRNQYNAYRYPKQNHCSQNPRMNSNLALKHGQELQKENERMTTMMMIMQMWNNHHF